MRNKPQNSEFGKLDALDEKQMKDFDDGKLYHILGDLRSLSYCGMLEIAKVNDIEKLEESVDTSKRLSTAIVKIHNPRTGWTGCGASQCENTTENLAFDIAAKKAYRNAIRLSLPPQYLQKCLKHFIAK